MGFDLGAFRQLLDLTTTMSNDKELHRSILNRVNYVAEKLTATGRQTTKEDILNVLPHLKSDLPFDLTKHIESHVYDNLAWAVDHTVLKPEAKLTDLQKLCTEAIENKFFAICVNGSRFEAVSHVQQSGVKVAVVIGFPLGSMTSAAKAFETKDLIDLGANEIDMVINVGQLKDGAYAHVLSDIEGVVKQLKPHTLLKVILECGALSKDEIVDASILSALAKAQYIKTSTGFGYGGAKVEDVRLMKLTVGDQALVKASGGIKTYADAVLLIKNGASRLGTSAGVAIFKADATSTATGY